MALMSCLAEFISHQLEVRLGRRRDVRLDERSLRAGAVTLSTDLKAASFAAWAAAGSSDDPDGG